MKLSLKKDQRGLAHVALVALVVAVIAVIGLVAWQVSKKKKDNSSGSTGTSTVSKKEVQSQCESVIDDKDLCKFAAAMSANDLAYTAVLSADETDGTTFTIKSDGKGNSETTTNSSEFNFNFILLDGKAYTKNADGSWSVTASTADPAIDPSKSLTYDFTQEDKDAYKKVGQEACGSLTCLKYQFTDKENPDDRTLIWFDTKDHRLQKLTFSSGEVGTSTMEFTYGKVTITKPSPIK